MNCPGYGTRELTDVTLNLQVVVSDVQGSSIINTGDRERFRLLPSNLWKCGWIWGMISFSFVFPAPYASSERQAKREYYTTKFQNPKTNPKHAWQTINDILGRNNNQSIIHEIKYSGKSVTSNEELKEIFNEYFTNIGPKLAQTIEHDSACNFEDFFTKRESVNEFSFEAVNESLVYTLIMKLPISKSVGLDKISTKLLQIAAPAITQPLTKIFNTAIDLDQFPLEWKAARVIPIFKKGQQTILDNYRLISILPVVSKLMERILYNQLSKYLEKESILDLGLAIQRLLLL